MVDIKRLSNKFNKNKLHYGMFFSCFYIIFFVARDIINHLIIRLISTKNGPETKKILFIEPVNQGYGDLFFQTSLFRFLNNSKYKVFVLTNKNHYQILYNNPNINGIFFWSLRDVFKIFKQNFIIIGLGRDTLRETFLMLFSCGSKKIVLDKNIKKWRSTFKNNSNTIAWNILVSKYLKIKLDNPRPKIYFSETEKNYIKKNKSENKIGIICEIENKEKIFNEIKSVIRRIPLNKEVLLFGKGNCNYLDGGNIQNHINKISYRDTIIKMAFCKTILGTEGSLTQISSSIVPKTIVLDINNTFIKNSHPDFAEKVYIIKNKNLNILVQKTLNQI